MPTLCEVPQRSAFTLERFIGSGDNLCTSGLRSIGGDALFGARTMRVFLILLVLALGSSAYSEQADILSELDGLWTVKWIAGGNSKLEQVLFYKNAVNTHIAALPFLPGLSTIKPCQGLECGGADIVVSGTGFECFYTYSIYNKPNEFAWIFKRGDGACPPSAEFARVRSAPERGSSAPSNPPPPASSAVVIPPLPPPPVAVLPPRAAAGACVVTDPTGTPLNVRESPGGSRILRTLPNGFTISVVRIELASGKPWAYVADSSGQALGWVYKPYITCDDERTSSKEFASAGLCVVTDPTGGPLNVRNAPRGPTILDTLANGYRVKILSIPVAAGEPWAHVAQTSGRQIGWVYRRYISCP